MDIESQSQIEIKQLKKEVTFLRNLLQKSILQEWVMKLGLRHQGVIVTALRGCDGRMKEDTSKGPMRELRWACLNPFDPRELDVPKGFMQPLCHTGRARFKTFASDLDGYPVHFVMHHAHACQVIGAHHYEEEIRDEFWDRYLAIVDAFHLEPEGAHTMDIRLNENRIKDEFAQVSKISDPKFHVGISDREIP